MKLKTPKEYREMEFRDFIFHLMCLLKPKSYAELGVKAGYTFNILSQLVVKAYAVDIKKQASVIDRANTEFFECTTLEFYNRFKIRKEKIDFIFVDADHNKIAVIKDAIMMKSFLTPYSGLMFLHDTYPVKEELLASGYCYNAWEAAKSLREIEKDFEIVTIPGPWAGLSILRYVPDNKHGWMDT